MAKAKQEEETIVAYKGFNADWTCRDFQYELGKTYVEKKADLCERGFHACEYPLDIFSYYPPTGQIAQVELGDVSPKTDSDSKRVGKSITIKASLSLHELIAAAVEFTFNRVNPATGETNSGVRGAASNSGYQGAASNSGYQGAASNSGDQGAASNSGDQGAASNSGVRGAASNSGYQGAASNSGEDGVAASFGYGSKAKSSKTGAIVLINRDDEGHIRHIRASKVGENGIKADVWYVLDADGEFQEAA